jgi:hypothetical protein
LNQLLHLMLSKCCSYGSERKGKSQQSRAKMALTGAKKIAISETVIEPVQDLAIGF